MAENHRHSAANSLSVNSYLVGARLNVGSASGGAPRTVSGKGTILVSSDTSSRSPPIIGPHRPRPQSPNPRLACAVDFDAHHRCRAAAGGKRVLLPTTYRSGIDTARRLNSF